MKNSNSDLQYHRITGILPTTAMFFLLRGMAGVVGHVFFVSAFSKPEIRMKVSTIVTSLTMIILMTIYNHYHQEDHHLVMKYQHQNQKSSSSSSSSPPSYSILMIIFAHHLPAINSYPPTSGGHGQLAHQRWPSILHETPPQWWGPGDPSNRRQGERQGQDSSFVTYMKWFLDLF